MPTKLEGSQPLGGSSQPEPKPSRSEGIRRLLEEGVAGWGLSHAALLIATDVVAVR